MVGSGWLQAGAPAGWPRPPHPRPEVSLVAWGQVRGRWVAGYVAWTDVDSWMARSRGGGLSARVLYTRWVPTAGLRPVDGQDYTTLPRLRLDGEPAGWPAPAVGPDGLPWYGRHRAYPPPTDWPGHGPVGEPASAK